MVTGQRRGVHGALLRFMVFFSLKYVSAIQITSRYFEAGLFIFIRERARRKRGSTPLSSTLLSDTSWRWETEVRGREERREREDGF